MLVGASLTARDDDDASATTRIATMAAAAPGPDGRSGDPAPAHPAITQPVSNPNKIVTDRQNAPMTVFS
jgi:hypothetical protein